MSRSNHFKTCYLVLLFVVVRYRRSNQRSYFLVSTFYSLFVYVDLSDLQSFRPDISEVKQAKCEQLTPQFSF